MHCLARLEKRATLRSDIVIENGEAGRTIPQVTAPEGALREGGRVMADFLETGARRK